ncbi:hypothetical protein EDB80DRAFT_701469 [Ilyonectria destructans]|nr:hypothetical protein EDB80DRAFT_701469 [Ilyonectria destructans]
MVSSFERLLALIAALICIPPEESCQMPTVLSIPTADRRPQQPRQYPAAHRRSPDRQPAAHSSPDSTSGAQPQRLKPNTARTSPKSEPTAAQQQQQRSGHAGPQWSLSPGAPENGPQRTDLTRNPSVEPGTNKKNKRYGARTLDREPR